MKNVDEINEHLPLATITAPPAQPPLDAEALRRLCLEAGADDVGFVAIDRPELDPQRDDILSAFPRTRTLVSFVCKLNPDAIRTPHRSVANLEFHHAGDETNEVARRIQQHLADRGVRAVSPAMGFPMEMDRFPGKIWVVSHKPVAVAAGLGHMGIHRNVIHPRFGNFILLGTLLTDLELAPEAEGEALGDSPCFECKLCVAACPTGAIKPDGAFDFSACYTHNYREFMGGFTDWVENVADSKDARDYRGRVRDPETVSMWQSLSFGANYKAAYCMAVCPAGEDVIGSYLSDKRGFKQEVLKPLVDKPETVYVIDGSDAHEYVEKRFPHKTSRSVGSGLRPQSILGFVAGLPILFQRGAAKDVQARFHFTFTGEESSELTVVIEDGTLNVSRELEGDADVRVTSDSRFWLDFLSKNTGVARGLLTGKLRIRGRIGLMATFQRCFPL